MLRNAIGLDAFAVMFIIAFIVPLFVAGIFCTIFGIKKESKEGKEAKEKTRNQQEEFRRFSTKENRLLLIYRTYLSELTAKSVIRQCSHNKPLTAALLFVIADITLANAYTFKQRQEKMLEIIAYLENKELSDSELVVYDNAVEVFAEIANGNLLPRGDWCHQNTAPEGWPMRLFVCYGDLMRFPEYISNYRSAQLSITALDEELNFYTEFMPLNKFIFDFQQLFAKYL